MAGRREGGYNQPTAPAAIHAMNPSASPSAFTPRPIFVVDDSDEDRELVLERLERAQVPNPIVACRHGTEAVVRLAELWRRSNPADWPCLILLDLRMPGMSGLEVLAWLNAQPTLHGLKVVMVSSCAKPENYDRAKSLGAHGFLLKYPSPESLASIVQLAAVDSALAPAHGPRA
jgi:CheY-like chemotaxis protein